ncbi:MAG: AGE family epimerase/isomerase [Alphaproteobacteria bacterium]
MAILSVYPVIMCGGSGTRLWPASRTGAPKQFIPLVGDRSSFQETVLRVRAIAGANNPLIVAGQGHRGHIAAQLAAVKVRAQLVLEPEGRDSAAAMAAAALAISRTDPDAILAIVSADHHVPDAAAFATAISQAAKGAAAGQIVTIGLKPRHPSTALGYILPGQGDGSVKPVAQFVEKPDRATAERYMREGYLWNCGYFIVSARVLIEELQAYAPDVLDAVRAGVDGGLQDGEALLLGEAFRCVRKISIDYAVMEKTTRAAVTPAAFDWTDIGGWDAVHAIADKDSAGNVGAALFVEASGNLVRAPAGTEVALVGVEDLAVVIEDGAVLVTSLAASQRVKAAGEHFKAVPRQPMPVVTTRAQARQLFGRWMSGAALPYWFAQGLDHELGGFRECTMYDGEEPARRARVQPRQVWSYAVAGEKDWSGPWRLAVQAGLASMEANYRRPDGLFRTLAASDGTIVDDEARLYDQAFALLAWSVTGHEDKAHDLINRLEAWRHPAGGWRETGARPFQSNAHMHLFEAALSWTAMGKDPRWGPLSDEIAELALTKFIDPAGFLREAFDAAWTPAAGDEGRIVEPGHQFEWAALLKIWAGRRGRPEALPVARKLFDIGLKGWDPARGVVIDGLWDDLSWRDRDARLWPQTEYLKAAMVFGEEAHVVTAFDAIRRYLYPDGRGLWFDLMTPDGELAKGPSPASTLYHLVGVWVALTGLSPV